MDALVGHGLLELGQEVLAQAHWPALAHLAADGGVLVDEAVDSSHGAGDLDGVAGEDGWEDIATHAQTLALRSVHSTHEADGRQEVADGGEATALALDDVVGDVISGSDSVCLQREVVVSQHLTLALNDLEHVVSSSLDLSVELDLEVALGVLEVLSHALCDSLCLSLTNGDGAIQSLVEVSLHSLSLLLDQSAVGLRSGVVVVDDTSHASELILSLLGVSSDSVGQHDDLGVEALLSVSQSVGGSDHSSGNLLVESVGSLELSFLLSAELLLEELGSLGQVLGHLDLVVCVDSASLLELDVEVVRQSSDLSSSSSLVLVHELTELAASLLGLREAVVGELLHTGEVLLDLGVDLELLSLHGHELGGDLLQTVSQDLGGVLHQSVGDIDLSSELLAEGSDLVGSPLASSTDVLHGLLEAGVSESSLLGEGVVEAINSGAECLLSLSTVVSELLVCVTELLLGLLSSNCELLLHELESLSLASSVLSLEALDSTVGALVLDLDGVKGSISESSDVSAGLLGDLPHLISVSGDLGVGRLESLSSLLHESSLCSSIGVDSILDHAGDLVSVGSDLCLRSARPAAAV